MILHSLKQITRSFWKYKSFSIINLLGLSLGIASVILIFLIADYEKNFDSYHQGTESIYRVVSKADRGGEYEYESAVPYPTTRLLRTHHPGLVATGIHYARNASVRIAARPPFEERNIVFADSLFFSVFDFSGVGGLASSGNPAKALSAPGMVVLTEKTAKKYFGTSNAVGQLIKVDAKLELQVAAVVKDPPPSTHLPFSMLISYGSLNNEFIGGLDLESWGFRSGGFSYVKVDGRYPIRAVEQALQAVQQKRNATGREKKEQFYLQPLRNIHFDPAFDGNNPGYTVSPRYLMMLTMLGIFIILIACVNYINLSTSVAFTKSKEVGVRKTIGASKTQLFGHYMLETALMTTMAAVIGCVIAMLFLPAVNRLLDKSMTGSQLWHTAFVFRAIAAIVLISCVSGIYPAMIMTGFKPVASLKNNVALPGRFSNLLRKALVVFQFTTSIALITCTLIIARQMQFFRSKSLGFNKEAVVEVALPSNDSARLVALGNMLYNRTGIQQVSFCLGAPISDNGLNTSLKAPELPEKADYNVKIIACDSNYLQTYGLRMVSGRWFLPGEDKNLGTAVVVNESLTRLLGYRTPAEALGKKITIGLNNYAPPIVGVVRDFHTSSLHDEIGPVAMLPFPFFYYAAGIRVSSSGLRNALSNIESAFKTVYPESVYTVRFVDEQLKRLYEKEARDYSLFKAFSAISIFICCIGLWGLIAFVVVRKTKEIGIRKVLGASISSIVALLSRDFFRLVLISLLIAAPVAGYFMHGWLENFAYRVPITWWVFVAAGLFSLLVAMLTISFQALRAALANPVHNLRSE